MGIYQLGSIQMLLLVVFRATLCVQQIQNLGVVPPSSLFESEALLYAISFSFGGPCTPKSNFATGTDIHPSHHLLHRIFA